MGTGLTLDDRSINHFRLPRAPKNDAFTGVEKTTLS